MAFFIASACDASRCEGVVVFVLAAFFSQEPFAEYPSSLLQGPRPFADRNNLPLSTLISFAAFKAIPASPFPE
jgi:hypothetical protein